MLARVGEVVPGGHMDKNRISSSAVVAFEDDPLPLFWFVCLHS